MNRMNRGELSEEETKERQVSCVFIAVPVVSLKSCLSDISDELNVHAATCNGRSRNSDYSDRSSDEAGSAGYAG